MFGLSEPDETPDAASTKNRNTYNRNIFASPFLKTLEIYSPPDQYNATNRATPKVHEPFLFFWTPANPNKNMHHFVFTKNC